MEWLRVVQVVDHGAAVAGYDQCTQQRADDQCPAPSAGDQAAAKQQQAGAPLPGVVNYLIGSDSTRWRTNLPTYAALTYQQLYSGIDLRYDGADEHLKSSYSVAPGADPARIRWRYLGPTDVRVHATTGNLVIRLPAPGPGHRGRTLIEQAPRTVRRTSAASAGPRMRATTPTANDLSIRLDDAGSCPCETSHDIL